MRRFGAFLARNRPAAAELTPTPAGTTLPDNPLELDEELFSAHRRPDRRRERDAAQSAARRQRQDRRARHHQGRGRPAGRSGQQDAARDRIRALREARAADGAQQYPHRLRQAAQRAVGARKEIRSLPRKLATTSSTISPTRRTCCARRKRRAPRSPSTSRRGAPRSPTWKRSSRRRSARARRCARKTSGSTNG